MVIIFILIRLSLLPSMAVSQVNEMDPAELDRWSVWDVEPTVEDWLAWGKDNVDSLMLDFINQNRAHLEHSGDIEPNKRYPSRRSWKRLNDVLAQAEALEAGPTMFNLAQSFVGFEAAVALNDFAKNYERVVTVEQLLNGDRVDALSAYSLNEHCSDEALDGHQHRWGSRERDQVPLRQ
jgi:hypothetical protein